MLHGYDQYGQIVYDTLSDLFPAGQPGHASAELAETFWVVTLKAHDVGQACTQALETVGEGAEDILYWLDGNFHVVASGFGEKSDWYRNVMSHPDVTIQVGRKRMTARAERLGLTEATEIMLDYNRHNPKLLRSLALILGYRTDGSEADVRFLSGVIPILAFTPYSL